MSDELDKMVAQMKKKQEEKAKKKPKEKELQAPEQPKEDVEGMNEQSAQIELLHNDGVFRLELIYQLQQINKALVTLIKTIDMK